MPQRAANADQGFRVRPRKQNIELQLCFRLGRCRDESRRGKNECTRHAWRTHSCVPCRHSCRQSSR